MSAALHPWFMRVPSAPDVVTWELTYRCNLKCAHCYTDSGPGLGREELTTEQIKSTLLELSAIGVFKVVFGGGEPFIRRDFSQILELVRRTKLSCQIATNGTLMSDELVDELLSPQIEIQVSLDGASPETHDRLRGVSGCFNTALENSKKLVSSGVNVSLCTTVWNANFDELDQIIRLAVGLGIRKTRFKRLYPVGRGSANWFEIAEMSGADVDTKLSELKRTYTKELDITCESHDDKGPTVPPKGFFNPAGITHAVITPEGNILPCPYLRNWRFIGGNLKQRRFADIWHIPRDWSCFRDPRNPWSCELCFKVASGNAG